MSERAHTWWLSPPIGASGRRGTIGQLAAGSWLRERGLSMPALTPWHVEVSLGIDDAPVAVHFDMDADTRLRIEIYSDEWGVFFCHEGRASWIRVTDIAFVHGRDDFRLLESLPALHGLGSLVQKLERDHAITFHRRHALIRTNVPGAEPIVRVWLDSL